MPIAKHGLVADRRGSVLVLFALALMMTLFTIGMGVDYVRAMRARAALAALADAAALMAVSKDGMALTPQAAKAQSLRFFTTQAKSLERHGLLMDYASEDQLSLVVEEGTGPEVSRRVKLRFQALNRNIFAKILGWDTLTLQGGAESATSTAPNIDFYVMIDTSPSMLLPATSAYVSQMEAATGGCAFACHETSNPRNNLDIARSNNIVLRTDLVTEAVKRLATIAKDAAGSNGATYRMGLSDFDYIYRQIWPTAVSADGAWVDADLDRARDHVGDSKVLAYCRNAERICGVPDTNAATDFTAAMRGVNAAIPTPGQGTSRPGDHPKAVLLIITDGMRDEYTDDRGRVMGPVPTALCDAIKARDVKIAMLNTTYLPESATGEWSIVNVRTPFLEPNNVITPALQACASPGLYHEVTINDDLLSSVSQLFQRAIRTAYLAK